MYVHEVNVGPSAASAWQWEPHALDQPLQCITREMCEDSDLTGSLLSVELRTNQSL